MERSVYKKMFVAFLDFFLFTLQIVFHKYNPKNRKPKFWNFLTNPICEFLLKDINWCNARQTTVNCTLYGNFICFLKSYWAYRRAIELIEELLSVLKSYWAYSRAIELIKELLSLLKSYWAYWEAIEKNDVTKSY